MEKCKQKDLLAEMLAEMTGDFPTLYRVFVSERDQYLARSLRLSATPIEIHNPDGGIFNIFTCRIWDIRDLFFNRFDSHYEDLTKRFFANYKLKN